MRPHLVPLQRPGRGETAVQGPQPPRSPVSCSSSTSSWNERRVDLYGFGKAMYACARRTRTHTVVLSWPYLLIVSSDPLVQAVTKNTRSGERKKRHFATARLRLHAGTAGPLGCSASRLNASCVLPVHLQCVLQLYLRAAPKVLEAGDTLWLARFVLLSSKP